GEREPRRVGPRPHLSRGHRRLRPGDEPEGLPPRHERHALRRPHGSLERQRLDRRGPGQARERGAGLHPDPRVLDDVRAPGPHRPPHARLPQHQPPDPQLELGDRPVEDRLHQRGRALPGDAGEARRPQGHHRAARLVGQVHPDRRRLADPQLARSLDGAAAPQEGLGADEGAPRRQPELDASQGRTPGIESRRMDAERAPLPVEGVLRFYNFLPEANPFLADVLAGLARAQKSLPPKYFYDDAGSRLFEQICVLPEYYPTRTELGIMQQNVAEMAQFIGPDTQLVELGSGAGIKTRLLIERLLPPLYVPIDIDGRMLRSASAQLAELFPWLNIVGLCADYTLPLELPQFAGLPIRRKAAFFPGSTVGNFTPEEALAFLRRVRRMAGAGGALLIGVDLKKDKATLEAAYDDAAGVTAKFNLNLLERINRELGGDFAP